MMTGRFVTVFAIVFAIVYTIAVEVNLPLVTYHPRLGEWGWLYQGPRTGPSMYWYGWLGTAALAALGASLLSLALPRGLNIPVWTGWGIPLACMIAFLYFLRMFFFR